MIIFQTVSRTDIDISVFSVGIVIYGASRNTLLHHLHIRSTNGVELNKGKIQRVLGISWIRRESDGNNVTLSRSRRLALHAASPEGGWPGWWSSSQGYFLGSSSQGSFRWAPHLEGLLRAQDQGLGCPGFGHNGNTCKSPMSTVLSGLKHQASKIHYNSIDSVTLCPHEFPF